MNRRRLPVQIATIASSLTLASCAIVYMSMNAGCKSILEEKPVEKQPDLNQPLPAPQPAEQKLMPSTKSMVITGVDRNSDPAPQNAQPQAPTFLPGSKSLGNLGVGKVSVQK